MKRFICALIALCLLLALAVPVYAEGETSGTCGEGVTWEVSGSTLTITGSGESSMNDFTEAPWAAYKDSITTVKITGVKYIGARSFKNFDNLTSVSFGSGLYEIGEEAFYDCDGLSSISLPESFKIFGASSFYSCGSLKTIRCAGRFPTFRSNSLWDTYAKIYYPADKLWPEDTIRELEEAFHGRIEFLDSNGTDHVKETEPKPTEPKPKPTNPPVVDTTPVETTTFPTVIWTDDTTPTVTRNTRPPVTIPEELEDGDDEGGINGWIAIVIVVGLLAGFAAVTIHFQQVQQRKRKAARRRRRPDQGGYNQ